MGGTSEGSARGPRLNVVLFVEDGRWVAQCLEYDIAAQADSIEAAVKTFARAFAAHVAEDIGAGKPLRDIPKAPAFYWDRLEEAVSGLAAVRAKYERLAARSDVPHDAPAFSVAEMHAVLDALVSLEYERTVDDALRVLGPARGPDGRAALRLVAANDNGGA